MGRVNLERPKLLYYLVAVSLVPFLWLFTQTEVLGGVQYATANIIGLIASVLLWWQFVLGIRFISTRITDDYIQVLGMHNFLGKYGALLALLHPVWMMFSFSAALDFLYRIDFSQEYNSHLTYGRISFLLLIVIWVTSALLRGRMRFRPWMYIHYLGYPMAFLAFLHAREIGTFINTFPVIQFYWSFFMISFFVIVIYRLYNVLNLGRSRYELISVNNLGKNITKYTFKPLGRKLNPKVGQFIYLRPGILWEAHPFTVMEFDVNSGVITLGIKTEGVFTKLLTQLEKGRKVFVDGPYGVFTREGQNSEAKVIMAGGIGVTPFVDLVKRFGDKNTYMFYANRNFSDAIKRDDLKKKLGKNYVEIFSKESEVKEPVVKGRINKDLVRKNLGREVIDVANFYVCGSKGFMESARKILAELGVSKDRIYYEEFSL